MSCVDRPARPNWRAPSRPTGLRPSDRQTGGGANRCADGSWPSSCWRSSRPAAAARPAGNTRRRRGDTASSSRASRRSPIRPCRRTWARSSTRSRPPRTGRGTERMVMYADFPFGLIHTANKDRMLDGACQGLATESNLVILSKTPIAMNGHPGREMNFETQEGHQAGKMTGRARIYLIGARMYQVFIAGPDRADHAGDDGRLPRLLRAAGPGSGTGRPRPWSSPGARNPARPASAAERRPPAGRAAKSVARPPAAGRLDGGPARDAELLQYPRAGLRARSRPMGGAWARRPGRPRSRAWAARPGRARRPRGAAIRSFDWVDADADSWAASAMPPGPDGTKDQHFRLDIDLPPNTIVESLAITSGPDNRWVTQPSDQWWPIAIYQNGTAGLAVVRRAGRRLLRAPGLRPVYQHRRRPRGLADPSSWSSSCRSAAGA